MNRPAALSVAPRAPHCLVRARLSLASVALLALALAHPGFGGSDPPQAPATAIQETRIISSRQVELIASVPSPDHRHLASVVQERPSAGLPSRLPGPTFRIGNPGPKAFHSKSVLSAGTVYRVYRDDRPSPPYSKVCAYCVALSPDAKHLAFAASRDSLPPPGSSYLEPCRNWSMVLDSTISPAYDDVSTPTFSPDGEHFAYLALAGGECFLVLDGKPGPSFASLARLQVTFSPDGDHVAYVAALPDSQFVVVDGRPGPRFAQVADVSLRFSPDGSRVAYVVALGPDSKQFAVVVDGHAELACDAIIPLVPKTGTRDPREHVDFVAFSSDSRHHAYAAEASSRAFVVIDGQPSRGYEAVFPPIFRGDGNRVWYAAQERGKWFLLRDGVPDPGRFDELRYNPVLIPPGAHWAHAVREGKKWRMIVDDVSGPEVDELWVMDLVFSADGTRCAYPARTGKKEFVVLDGKAGPSWDLAGNICLSPDGRHMAYAAKQGGKAFVLVDGVAGPAVDDIANQSVRFRPDGSEVEYIAERDGIAYRIRQAVVPTLGGR